MPSLNFSKSSGRLPISPHAKAEIRKLSRCPEKSQVSIDTIPKTEPDLKFFEGKDGHFLVPIPKNITPWKFNSSPLKISHPKRKIIFQASFFRGELLNFGGVEKLPPHKFLHG